MSDRYQRLSEIDLDLQGEEQQGWEREDKKAAGGPSPSDVSGSLAQQQSSSSTVEFLKKFFKQQPASQSNALPSTTPLSAEQLKEASALLRMVRGPYDSKNPLGSILKFIKKKADVLFHSYEYLESQLIASKDFEKASKYLERQVQQFNSQSGEKYKLTVDYQVCHTVNGKRYCFEIEDIPDDLLKAFLKTQARVVSSESFSDPLTSVEAVPPESLSDKLTSLERSSLLAMAVSYGDDDRVRELLKKAVINEAVLDSLLSLPGSDFKKMFRCLLKYMSNTFLSETALPRIKELLELEVVLGPGNIERNCILFAQLLFCSPHPYQRDIAEQIASFVGCGLIFDQDKNEVRIIPLEDEEGSDQDVAGTPASSSQVIAETRAKQTAVLSPPAVKEKQQDGAVSSFSSSSPQEVQATTTPSSTESEPEQVDAASSSITFAS